MNNEKITIKEATQKWVGEFNSIPLSLIEKAYPDFSEIYFHSTQKECEDCQSTDIEENKCCYCESEEVSDNYSFPMWGTVWSLHSLDEDWVLGNLDIVSDCGFYVYETDEIGVFIGIDGAGYDFYEAHWIPLYKARSLQWHNVNE